MTAFTPYVIDQPNVKGLFWNTHENVSTADVIAELTFDQALNVVVLAQFSHPASILINKLNQVGIYGFCEAILSSRLRLFHSGTTAVRAVYDDEIMSIRGLSLPNKPEILLGMLHLPSKMYCSSEDQSALCSEYIKQICIAEQKSGHGRTMLVGDFNMNPFEAGMVQATGFHGISSREIARRGQRIVHGRKYGFFYNPMWRFFGDDNQTPGGTWCKTETKPIAYFWHLFDQVLVRPDLIGCFDDAALSVVTSTKTQTLLSDAGRPLLSDHFPITYGLI